MSDIFADYSEVYDLLYEDKPYREESSFVDGLLKRYAVPTAPIRRVLDLACGTGRHCFELEAMGYQVEGSDISAAMIQQAQLTAVERGGAANFYNYSFQNADRIAKKYDAVISMFSAICYLTTHQDLLTTLDNINGLLEPGGLFVFDYWNGNAVVKDYSPRRELRKQRGNLEVVRASTTSLDLINQIAEVNFHFAYFDSGVKRHEFTERHLVRYFFFREIESYLELAGFDLIHRSGFLKDSLEPDDWNVTVVARKRAA